MEQTVSGTLTPTSLILDMGAALGKVILQSTGTLPTEGAVLLFDGGQLQAVTPPAVDLAAGQVGVQLMPPPTVTVADVRDFWHWRLTGQATDHDLSAADLAYVELVETLLQQLGLRYDLRVVPSDKATSEVAPKKPAAKPRHRWSRAVAAKTFFVDHEQAIAEVVWRKRNEMVIKKGARMKAEAPLNQNGELGFSARFAQQLRQEHQGEFTDFVTTTDIVLKSVNEVGLFLYFAGTNSWLVLKDAEGKSIHDWTVVE
ncbi:hypothetical protein [Lapidilactobacillus luobeiensis]|uniref:hypothetical protein n=1 Tax=Lapidilactobacillus luobeiensis TaxID=2950371 RepID=UPI0021C3E177|nr:hypothetical protein [Lapidilactobacillus luobeiensis]